METKAPSNTPKKNNKNYRYKKNKNYKGKNSTNKNNQEAQAGNSVRPNRNAKNKVPTNSDKTPSKRRYNKPSASKGFAAVIRKYEHFMEMYVNTRRKYFSLSASTDKKAKTKSEATYKSSIEQLRKFEQELTPENREKFNSYICRADEDQTITNKLKESGELEDWNINGNTEEEMDPHLLPTQKDTLFANDQEITEATEDDLKAFSKTKD